MILYFKGTNSKVFAVQITEKPDLQQIEKLNWLFGGAELIKDDELAGTYIGPRKEMITPWSTNAVEITQNMGITDISRIEELFLCDSDKPVFDRMLQQLYNDPGQEIFKIDRDPEPVKEIDNIAEYNKKEGLALSNEEISYLENISNELGRKLTDSEVFGFSQVNSEHCRHKIFNGTFIINDEEKKESLFELIKKTSRVNPNKIVSAYKDNVAFLEGPEIEQFAPKRQDIPDYFVTRDIHSVISLKAETHNFPTTVEPFNGAATGSGGEIRDRMAGGKGSIPLAGTAVYMTPYSRLDNARKWEINTKEREWLYQTPLEILIKASNGASDFGNKFGQPLIGGSVLTFEHTENGKTWGFDKVIMLAGGIGFGILKDSKKDSPESGDKVIVMGGDNYRIGMGGGAVSSVATGEYENTIELNAIQRSNPEMQKRVYNVIRAMTEMDLNPVVSIHDHGAGGHLNCLSELLEESGGKIDIKRLPVGDPTLSDKEIIGNESQERMGLVMKEADTPLINKIAERERSPIYIVGEATGDHNFIFLNSQNNQKPINWKVDYMFGSSPKTILEDQTLNHNYKDLEYELKKLKDYLKDVLKLEAVGCKDWLTNKVDRCVTGKVAKQQTAGPLQLPLNNVAVMALDYQGLKGVATSIGHAPIAGLANPEAMAQLSVTEALTNLVWAPLSHGRNGISLSANWMWPARNPGENERLYHAVEAISKFSIDLGINIPTGKDSLSMIQKYPDGKTVYSPGTVIISTVAEVDNINNVIEPVLVNDENTLIFYIDFSGDEFHLGGSSFAQILSKIGNDVPQVKDPDYVKKAFDTVQLLIKNNLILAGHDIGSGGMITSLLEMCFANKSGGMDLNFDAIHEKDLIKILFSEKPAVIIQTKNHPDVGEILENSDLKFYKLGKPDNERLIKVIKDGEILSLDIDSLREIWFETSYLLDLHQSEKSHAQLRFKNYKENELQYVFPRDFTGKPEQFNINSSRKTGSGIKAAIIREKGVNGDREMAWCMHLAGFDVKDIHMTDLISGSEDLSDVYFIVFVGGFSNSDVLGSAKGWAGAFLYNDKAKASLEEFYKRDNTLSLGVCNGCQLMMELGLVYPELKEHPKLHHNASGKFECHFLNVDIPENNSVMLSSLSGTRLGIWAAHGEGRFILPEDEEKYQISGKYSFVEFPGNPNGSDFNAACMHSADGRHLVMMPHLERSLYPWNWAYYPSSRKDDIVSPWIEAFVNAREWIKSKI